ncbi:MAG: DUF234 domain-containing protein [Sulfurimonas sp.]|nr:DUF234 domain-containing protein [Sulfurimonas sp.]
MKMLLEQFRSFYFDNYHDDMESLIEHFAVFGGLKIEVDTSMSISELIHIHILNDYEHINDKIKIITANDSVNIRLLRALAVGDRRIFSAFKRAGLNNGNGGAALNFLKKGGIIEIEESREINAKKAFPSLKLKRELARHRISHKVLFNHPFIRFWFYFVVPHSKEIKEGNFNNFFDSFNQKQNQFTSLVFEELSELLLNYNLRDAGILNSGSYWDMNVEIDILTQTDDNQLYVGECKWTNHKINKKELHKLNEKCEKLGIKPAKIVFFSKRGYSKELEKIQGKELSLYSSEDFKALLKKSKA